MKKARQDEMARKTAVLYIRFSTKKQAEQGFSLEEQEKSYRSSARSALWKWWRLSSIPGIWTKYGSSGLVQLLAYCGKRCPAYVVVSSLSRLARTVQGQAEALQQLRSFGTRVLSVGEPSVDDTAQGKLSANIVGSF